MVAVHLEKVFYHYIFETKDYVHLVNEKFFETEVINELFKISKTFFEKYNDGPSKKQLEELIKLKGLEEKITPEKLDIIFDVDLAEYGGDWLDENIEAWIEYRNLDSSVFDLLNYLQTTNVTVDNVKEVVETAKAIILERNQLDFKFDSGLDFFDPDSHEQPTSHTFSTGYNFIDKVTGGFSIKTLWVFMGAAKVGKCAVGDTMIRVRNKKTGDIQEITMKEFHDKTKKSFL